jgi:8-oxo-dGTP diphosphatase
MRNKPPYPNTWNGVGGKIEEGETVFQSAVRECEEETNIKINDFKLLKTDIYPEGTINNNVELNILYSFTDEIPVESDHEGVYEWKPIQFAMDFYNEQLAGFGNVAQFMREIFIKEGLADDYKKLLAQVQK